MEFTILLIVSVTVGFAALTMLFSYLLRKRTLLRFIPFTLLVIFTGIIYYVYTSDDFDYTSKEISMGSRFSHSFGQSFLFLIICICSIITIGNLIYTFFLIPKVKCSSIKNVEDLWECPDCGNFNKNTKYACEKCDYKVN